MGMLHLRREPVSLADLVRSASGIARVRPADPPRVVEEVTLGGGPPGVPHPPAVTYPRVFDRFVVEEWLLAPGARPEVIEVASPSNEASARDAQDAANGMLGHVHHVVFEYALDEVPEAWRAMPEGQRIVFLSPTSIDPASVRFVAPYGGLSVGPAAREAVLAALPRPVPGRRAYAGPVVVTGFVLAGLVLAVIIGRLILAR